MLSGKKTLQTLSSTILGSLGAVTEPSKPKRSFFKKFLVLLFLAGLIAGGYYLYDWSGSIDNLKLTDLSKKVSEGNLLETAKDTVGSMTKTAAPSFDSSHLSIPTSTPPAAKKPLHSHRHPIKKLSAAKKHHPWKKDSYKSRNSSRLHKYAKSRNSSRLHKYARHHTKPVKLKTKSKSKKFNRLTAKNNSRKHRR